MAQEFLQGPHLAKLVEAERITIAAGVPTVLDDVLRAAVADGRDLSTLRLLVCGGAAVPPSLIERWAAAGVELLQGWGMTETNPLCALARPPRGTPQEEEMAWRSRTGRPIHGVELRIVDDDGNELPWDDEAVGEIQVRGPWVAGSYHREPAPEKFDSRLAADRRRRPRQPAGFRSDHRPDQGRDQVRRRVDLLDRAREPGDGPSLRPRGGRDRRPRRALGGATARLPRARGRRQQSRSSPCATTSARRCRGGASPSAGRCSTRCRRRASASSTRRRCGRPTAATRSNSSRLCPGRRRLKARGRSRGCARCRGTP